MVKRRDCVIGASVAYLFLLMLFFMVKDKVVFNTVCYHNSPCVRFCCDDPDTCTDKFIRSNFDERLVPKYSFVGPKTERDLKLLFGAPHCSLEPVSSEIDWKFSEQGAVKLEQSEIREYKNFFDFDQYCLQDWKTNNSDVTKWKLFICENNSALQRYIHYLLISMSALFVASTLALFVAFKELRTIQGKCEIFFLIGTLVALIALPILDPFKPDLINLIPLYVIPSAFLLSFTWLSVMCFDVWWSFRKVQVTSDDNERFRTYCYSGFGLLGLFFVAIVLMHVSNESVRISVFYAFVVLWLSLFLLAFADIVFLILTSVKVFQMSRSTNIADHSWFEEHKDRYFTVLQMFVIMCITWPIKLYTVASYRDYEAKIVSDVIVFLSAMLLFAIIGMKKHIRDRISSRYGILNES